MRFKVSKAIFALCLAFLIGGHWMVLQSVAWVGMAVDFSKSCSVREALTKTFDGKHPCKLCKFVREGKCAEKDQDTLKGEPKLDVFCAFKPIELYFPRLVNEPFITSSIVSHRLEAPPVPPPRQA